MNKKILIVVVTFWLMMSASAAVNFVAQKIEVSGLQHISRQTLMSYLPVQEGSMITPVKTAEIIHALYKTGFFDDVSLAHRDNVLFITVVERPAIGTISIVGNKEITRKQLTEVMRDSGIAEGEIFSQAALTSFTNSLTQQYYSMGRYNAIVKVTTAKQERNRVAININIAEGEVAKIKKITIVGNHAFNTSTLLKNFALTTSGFFTFITHSDRYSKEKLDADLEKLRTFYLDHGYLRFKIDSSNTDMNANKTGIYITIYVTEGAVYHISGFDVSGILLGKSTEIRDLITLKRGDTFSRQTIIDITTSIEKFLGDYGYATPVIAADPVINDAQKQVWIKFAINPKHKTYIRRISFSGNTKTNDEVLRREMRQQEDALFSYSKINESKRRLSNLGYLQDIESKMEPTPEDPDVVDLVYKVKEVASAMANFQVGYSDVDGFLYGISVNEHNFMGTGKEVGLQFNNSSYNRVYGFTYYNPYYTPDNVSFGLNIYAEKTTPGHIDLSSYTANNYGFSSSYGIPLSDYMRLSGGYGYAYTQIKTNNNSSNEVRKYIQDRGRIFNEGKLTGSWSYNDLDRAIFPLKGWLHGVDAEVDIPVTSSSLKYYKTDYSMSWYRPLVKDFIFHARALVDYGNGFGNTEALPFFANYYAGGISTVRGFEGSSLGPRDSNNNPIGGAFAVSGSLGVIVPHPLQDVVRTTVFIDAGNVYRKEISLRNLRSSCGIQAEWRSPLGAVLIFVIAQPIKRYDGDRTQLFDFSFGTSF